MKRSLFAKILILILCLSLVLCACGEDASQTTDPTDAPTVQNTDPTDPAPADPSDPSDPSDAEEALGELADKLGTLLDGIFGTEDGEPTDDAQCAKITLTVGDMMSNIMYVDVTNLQFVDELTVNVEGTEINAQVYLNRHDLVLVMPDMLPDNYGISFDTLVEDLPDSAIWDLIGMSFDEFMEQLSTALEGMMGSMEGTGSMLGGSEELINSLMEALNEALTNVEQTTTTGQVEIYARIVDANITRYSVDAEAMESIVNILLDWCNNNTEGVASMLASTGITAEMLQEYLNQAKTEVGTFFDNADLTAALVLNQNIETGAMMSIEVSLEGTIEGVEGGYYLNLTLGVDPATSGLYTFKMADHDGNGYLVEFRINTMDTFTTLSLTAYELCEDDAILLMIATAQYDTASYDYQLTFSTDEVYYAINGICKVTEDYFEFTLDTLTQNEEVTQVNFRLVAEPVSSSEIPEAPAYTNVLQMSELELTSLISIFEGFGAE